MANPKHRNALKTGYELHWYTIQDVLGQGGFGITYLAHDANLKQSVAIKEYLPSGIAMREPDNTVHPITDDHRGDFTWGLERFLTEARTLTRFDHSNIVRVVTVFELNQTAYMVMRYEQGQGLDRLLPRDETLSEQWLKKMLFPIIGGLSQVHAEGYIHRDIKPPNIFIREDNSPVLIDFGSARQALGQETRTLTAMISPGYAPFEQYHAKSDQQGPWTDIYGLGATLYRGVTGQSPADALVRSEALLKDSTDPYVPAGKLAGPSYSSGFLAAIDAAMQFREKDRPQTLKLWLEMINQVGATTKPAEHIQPLPGPEAETQAPLTLVPDSEIEAKITTANPHKRKTKKSFKSRLWSLAKKILKVLLILFVILVVIAIIKGPKDPSTTGDATPGSELGNLTSTEGNTDNLANEYQRRLSENPNDAEARSALETLVDFHMTKGTQAFANGNNQLARAHFRQAWNAATSERKKTEIRRTIDSLRQ